MNATEILVSNVDRLCREQKLRRMDLAKKMGVEEASLSRSLRYSPRLDTVEKIAKALNVSIKSLFEDPDKIDGFVSVGGAVHRINSLDEFEKIVKDSRPKLDFTISSFSGIDDDEGLPF